MGRLPGDVALMCAASDGVDGSSGAAGALVTRADAEQAGAQRIEAALRSFDDASVHEALGTHLPGGSGGNNLTDVHVVARLRR
jgi:hydroxypyruvate reductase